MYLVPNSDCIYMKDYIEQSKIALLRLSSQSTAKPTTAMERISIAKFADMHLAYMQQMAIQERL